MKRLRMASILAAALLVLGVGSASAWQLQGHVYCDGTGLPLVGATVKVVNTDAGDPFEGTGVTDENGFYLILLLDVPRSYRACIQLGASDVAVTPPSGCYDFTTSAVDYVWVRDFVIASPSCQVGACWLTGGGARISLITGGPVGDVGKWVNFGGNVNPGCSPTAGDGGNWNTLDKQLKLHFQGTHIEVIRCGNVDGIPPGSDSPETPFNFIEFQGTGHVSGIQGNKADYPLVYFFGHFEDRNEPGSSGAKDGALKDRYFLNVFTNAADPVGSSIMLVDVDKNPATMDPIAITDGNLQIHITSCSAPQASAIRAPQSEGSIIPVGPGVGIASEDGATLSPAMPNPATDDVLMRFSLSRSSDVQLGIFDVAGRRVADLMSARLPAGAHSASWNLRDRAGMPVRGGVYFMRLIVDGAVHSRSLSVAR